MTTKIDQLTDEELEAVWHQANEDRDMTMVEIAETAMDGDAFYRGLALGYVRNVPIYQQAIARMRGSCAHLQKFVDEELPDSDANMFRAHLTACQSCQDRLLDATAMRERVVALGRQGTAS